jgi:hypothetical protein
VLTYKIWQPVRERFVVAVVEMVAATLMHSAPLSARKITATRRIQILQKQTTKFTGADDTDASVKKTSRKAVFLAKGDAVKPKAGGAASIVAASTLSPSQSRTEDVPEATDASFWAAVDVSYKRSVGAIQRDVVIWMEQRVPRFLLAPPTSNPQ